MAINPELIQFFQTRISNASMKTFGSEVTQLYTYLKEEIKDNPIYLKYEEESLDWKIWLQKVHSLGMGKDSFPIDFHKAKSLAYSAYKLISERQSDGSYLPADIIGTGNYNEGISDFNTFFFDYFSKALEDIIRANPELEAVDHKQVLGDTVFIIHGHDDHLKTEIQLLLVRAGVCNIILHEQADMGRTLIDKLIQEGGKSNYAIALLSPDDILDNGQKRARQNVILEIGFFIGLLGKERIRILVKEEVEIPSDINGVLYEKYDKAGNWKMKILKELQAVGIFVDLNSVFNNL